MSRRAIESSGPDLCQGSSAVEQGTHKPLVGSSILPPGSFINATGLHSEGSSGRHYMGSAVDLDARFAEHLHGHTATTKRLGGDLAIVARKEVATAFRGSKD
jgi:hypothetical protein